jgi:hypothetical protein
LKTGDKGLATDWTEVLAVVVGDVILVKACEEGKCTDLNISIGWERLESETHNRILQFHCLKNNL